jgi:ppGpp synthetase/RelA/SpoT-type nucleotidyltranferase
VHVIVSVDELPVEVQIRTKAQHLWAEVFERLADRLGRAIRYGGLPQEPGATMGQHSAQDLLAQVIEASQGIAITEKLEVDLKELEESVASLQSQQATADLQLKIGKLAREVADAKAKTLMCGEYLNLWLESILEVLSPRL